MAQPGDTEGPRYAFTDADRASERRLLDIAELQDPYTILVLGLIGVEPGWRCAEIGAGAGTIAAWLADRVGSSGSVLATDIDTRWIEPRARPNLEIRRHDIVVDPLEPGAFQLIHARSVLSHVADWRRVVARLVTALAPGGWLILEEADLRVESLHELAHPAASRLVRAIDAFQVAGGGSSDIGREVAGALYEEGLVDIAGHVLAPLATTAAFASTVAAVAPMAVARGLLTEAEGEMLPGYFGANSSVQPIPALQTSVRGRRPPTP